MVPHFSPKKDMIKTQDLIKIVKLVLVSGDIKNQKPISLLIVSKSGNGKTQLIKSFRKRTAIFFTDLSYSGLIETLGKDPRIKHVIIPDFIKITQKKRSTSDNFVSLLNAVTEEGVGKIRLFNVNYDLKDRTIGLITATTKESFNRHKKVWHSFGFMQRMLIISYDYSLETIQEILSYINREKFIDDKPVNMSSVGKTITGGEDFNKQLNKLAHGNFRALKHLQTLAKCNAYLERRNKVTQKDIDEIVRLSDYINLSYKKI